MIREALVEPVVEAVDLAPRELAVVEGVGQRGHALAEGQDVHRVLDGLGRGPECLELFTKPRQEQLEDADGLAACGVIEFGEFVGQGL
ncbi:hypothetical protein [Streptomyces sp. WZ.A104]|uniref:hypothetical protein n=1 Tax=Streptomyces sp. WZ.A104 TaxID=2023771 RepID=UPI0015C7BC2F|nr:hypothetical protein [Streptomyces sp. WZ.A104]